MNIARSYERQRYIKNVQGIKIPVSTDWVRVGTCPLHQNETLKDGVMAPKIVRSFEGINGSGWIFYCDGIIKKRSPKGGRYEEYEGAHRFVNQADPSPRKLPSGVRLKRYVSEEALV